MVGCGPPIENLSTAHQEHRNLRSVLCRKPNLDLTEALRVKGDSSVLPTASISDLRMHNCMSEAAS